MIVLYILLRHTLCRYYNCYHVINNAIPILLGVLYSNYNAYTVQCTLNIPLSWHRS